VRCLLRPVKRNQHHPTVIAACELFCRQAPLDPDVFWAAIEGRPTARAVAEGLVAAFHPLVRLEDFVIDERLSFDPKNGTIGTMSATQFASAPRGRPMENLKHPLMAALKKAGVTVTEEAESVNRSPPSLRSFCKPKSDPSNRPVPLALAKHWLKKYGVPLSAWARVGD